MLLWQSLSLIRELVIADIKDSSAECSDKKTC